MATDMDQDTTFDPNRRLCPDGNCVGVIGRDGKCSICATVDPDWRESSVPEQEAVSQETVEASDQFPPAMDQVDQGDESDFDPGRRLCSDGSCIGVIDSDNCCTVCRKPALS
jgi:hypothetical protein